MTKLLLISLTLALSLASAKTYTFRFLDNVVVNGSELQAGDYKVDVLGDKITLSRSGMKIQCPARVETAPTPYKSSVVRYTHDATGARHLLQEFSIGGTNLKIVVNQAL